MEVVLAGVIFVVTYAAIATDRVDKTVAALLGGSLVVVLGLVGQEEAFEAIDLNVIFLLAGMMIMAGILRRTGFFQWMAIRSVKVAGGEPFRLLLVLSTVCAVLSAFLDNVTTVVLIAPVTIYIASVLRVSPLPFLIAQILAATSVARRHSSATRRTSSSARRPTSASTTSWSTWRRRRSSCSSASW